MRVRQRVFEIVEVARPGDRVSQAFDWLIIGLIALSVVEFVIETVEPIADKARPLFRGFEAT
ncbi:MAG: hypothetical protein V2A79_12645, partial [Planctomycetota bacterium]